MRITLILILLIILCACSTINVVKINKNTSSDKPGIIYALPAHEFDVIVDYQKTVKKGSVFLKDNKITKDEMKDALKHFGLRLPFSKKDQNETSYEIKKISINTRVVPDEKEFYFIETSKHNHPFNKKTFLFELTNQGYLAQANASGEDYTVDFVLNTATTIAKVAAGIVNPVPAGAGKDSKEIADSIAAEIQSSFPKLRDLYLLLGQYTELESYKQSIYKGEPNLTDLGQNPDFTFIIKQIEKEQNEIAKFFVGSKTTTDVRRVFNKVPKVGVEEVFKFSKLKGFGTGDSYQIKITKYGSNSLKDFVEINANNTQRQKGLHYRIPATTLVSIYCGKKEHYRAQHVIPQMGVTSFLPDRVGLVKNDLKYTLDPKTGALLKFEANGSGVDLDAVKAFQDSAAEIPALFQQPKENEFESLEKQLKRLELENSVIEQQIRKDSLSKAQDSGS